MTLGKDPLGVLRSYKNADIRYETGRNRHIPSQIDTTFYITIGSDYFEIYKAASENFLSEALIQSGGFDTKHGLETGVTKKRFLEIMDNYSLGPVPDNVRLKNKIVREWIDLKFVHDKIKRISFKGYVD